MNHVCLPWPPAECNPNKRLHWARVRKAGTLYRYECAARARVAVSTGLIVPDTRRIRLRVEFYPPDRRHRDDDNAFASFKSGRDGLADAFGINDRRFRFEPVMLETPVKGGMVKAIVEPLTDPG